VNRTGGYKSYKCIYPEGIRFEILKEKLKTNAKNKYKGNVFCVPFNPLNRKFNNSKEHKEKLSPTALWN
jgi:hypothetical protein